MKKAMLLITLVLFTVCIVSCTTTDPIVDDPDKTIENKSDDNKSSGDIDDTSYNGSNEPQEEPVPPDAPEITELALREIAIELQDFQIIDASPLYHTETLGSRKTYENMLPQIIGFEYPYVYYERMSAIVKDAEPRLCAGKTVK